MIAAVVALSSSPAEGGEQRMAGTHRIRKNHLRETPPMRHPVGRHRATQLPQEPHVNRSPLLRLQPRWVAASAAGTLLVGSLLAPALAIQPPAEDPITTVNVRPL